MSCVITPFFKIQLQTYVSAMHGNQEILLLTCQLTIVADDGCQNQSTDLFTALQANLRLDGASIVRVIYLALTFTNVKVRKHVKTNQLI